MSYPLTESKKTQKTIDFRVKYKTQKCRYLIEKGYCPFNAGCAFAHSDDEIREKWHISSNYKTRECINFFKKGFCKYGDRCQYIHVKAVQDCKDSEGHQTRSNSEESSSSKSSKSSKSSQQDYKVTNQLGVNRRIQLLANFGYQIFLIRSNKKQSRLKELLHERNLEVDEFNLSQILPLRIQERKDKKYSL